MNTSLRAMTNSSAATATDNSSPSDALAARNPSPVRPGPPLGLGKLGRGLGAQPV